MAAPLPDINIFVAGLIDDLSSIQTSMYPRRAYDRAARSVALVDRPLTEMTREDIARIPHIGHTPLAIAREVAATGHSPTATARLRGAVTHRGTADERRARREGFISRAAARQVLASKAGRAVGAAQYRGDFQMHSTWSDGHREIAEMAVGAIDRGYSHLAITDHSAGLQVANGLTPETLRRQHKEIDALNKTLRGRFTVLKGVEANIRADGRVDVALEDRRRCDIVLAAPHSALDADDDQTERLLKALAEPCVDVLAHPSGRKFGKRAGLRVDWGRVFRAAARKKIAIEIDGDPSRQDLPYALVVQALAAGCIFAIDSDAHDVGELAFVDIGLAHARLAGVPPARVINCWPLPKLRAWLRARR